MNKIKNYDGICEYCGEMGDCILTPAFKWACPDCISSIIEKLDKKCKRLQKKITDILLG
jgi:hypothetical protein